MSYDPEPSHKEQTDLFRGLVVAHAAVNGGMMANFGRRFAQQLVEQGAELHFFASQLPVFGWSPPIEDLERLGGQFHGLPLSESIAPWQDVRSLLQMAVELRQLQVQVIHTRSSIMGAVGRLAAKLAGVPLIIHHQDDLHCRSTQLSPMAKRITAVIERQLARLADRSLFISKAVLEDAVAIGFPRERCVLVGLDLSSVFQDAAFESERKKEPVLSRFREMGISEDTRIVGCVGRLAHIKGIDLFLAAAERLAPRFPKWAFVIKGDGPMRESIRAAIEEKGLSQVIFLVTDEMAPQDLPALYRCFDLFALPTRREGFGMVFVEAMAMGIPVIGSRIAPVTELIPDGCGILVEPDNVAALTEALATMMNDNDLRVQVAEQGRAHALATWCGYQAADRVLDVYRELLST